VEGTVRVPIRLADQSRSITHTVMLVAYILEPWMVSTAVGLQLVYSWMPPLHTAAT